MSDVIETEEGECCFYCGVKEALTKCLECNNNIFYCSDSHKKIHCPSPPQDGSGQPEKKCTPFRVAHSQDRGHFLVATREIKVGEIVLLDKPFVEGPASKSPPVCLQCFKDTPSSTSYRCSKCGLPVCNKVCEDGHLHQYECQYFAKAFRRKKCEEEDADKPVLPDIGDSRAPCPLYTCITPLRLLLRSHAASTPEEKEIVRQVDQLVDHEEERKKDKKTWTLNHVLVVSFIQRALGLHQDTEGPLFSTQQIHRAIGLLRTNGVKLDSRPGATTGVAIYPVYSLTNHDCLCNTRTKKIFINNEHVLELISVLPIQKGEEISTRYTPPQLGTIRRQQLVQTQWYFSCRCHRCLDPTEKGSMLNSLKCTSCQTGYMLPKDPTQLGSKWKCLESCHQEGQEEVGAMYAMKLLLKVESEIGNAEKIKDLKEQYEALNSILNEHSGKNFHPNHFLMTGIRERLIQVLIQTRKSEQDNQRKVVQLLKRQVDLFETVANVMSKVDLPSEFWSFTMEKMQRELQEAEQKGQNVTEP